MATLTGNTVASTYKQLLKVTSEGIGADASAKYIEDGLGTDSALSISTTRVGIGTAVPDSILNIKDVGVSTATKVRIKTFSDETGVGSTLNFDKSHNDDGSTLTTTIDGSLLGRVEFRGVDSSGNMDDGAYIAAEQNGTASGRIPTKLTFATYSDSAEKIPLVLDSNSRISLSNNDGNTGNTVFGKNALTNNGTVLDAVGANYNIAIGELAMGTGTTTTAIDNIAIGYKSLEDITSGDYNTSVGANSLASLTDAERNTAIGWSSLYTNVSGDYNTGLGMYALYLSSTDNNTGVGYSAGMNTTGADNTYVGYFAGKGAAGADANNVGVGSNALLAITTGANNVAIGKGAMVTATTAAENVAVGYQSLDANLVGSYNTAVGYESLTTFVADADNEGENTVVGHSAGKFVSTGTGNTFVGKYSGLGITGTPLAGDNNTGIGRQAGTLLQGAAHSNTFVGNNAGYTTTTGVENTIIGYNCRAEDATASNQIVIGEGATGVADNSVTLGNASVTAVYASQDGGAVISAGGLGIGLAAVAPVTALDVHSAGTEVAASFGMADDGTAWVVTRTAETQNNYGAYGFMVGTASTDGVGSSTTTAYIASSVLNDGGALQGDLQFATNSGDGLTQHFNIAGNGDLTGTDTSIGSISDERFKKNIKDYSGGLATINALRPVTFEHKVSTKLREGTQRGFIAQEVEKVDSFWTRKAIATEKDDYYSEVKDTDGEYYISKINEKDTMYVSAIKELLAKVDALEAKVTALEGE